MLTSLTISKMIFRSFFTSPKLLILQTESNLENGLKSTFADCTDRISANACSMRALQIQIFGSNSYVDCDANHNIRRMGCEHSHVQG
jgi:hypothetical protein